MAEKNIESQLETVFSNNIYSLAEQRNSLLNSSSAIINEGFRGRTKAYTRFGSFELKESSGRNPKSEWEEYMGDRRWQNRSNFVKEIIMDKYDNLDAVADTSSTVYQEFFSALNRAIDRKIVKAALGPVLVGADDSQRHWISAEDDGVNSVDATSGLTYQDIISLRTNYIHRNVEISGGVVLAVSESEEGTLMNDEKFINNNYTNIRPVDDGKLQSVSGLQLIKFAGNKQSDPFPVENPILPETGGTRFNVCLAPRSIIFSMSDLDVKFYDSLPDYQRSKGFRITVRLSALRIEGAKVQTLKTTIL
jgi:hypothetical protein